MNDTLATITTTPVPMAGYDDSVVGDEWVTSHFRSVSEALCPKGSPEPRCVIVRQATAYFNHRLFYDAVRPQATVIDSGTLPLHPEPGQPVTTVTGLESARCAFEEAVRRSFLSFFVAALKARATGDMTRPIILHWAGHGGGRTDLSTGRWVIQLRDRLSGYWTNCRRTIRSRRRAPCLLMRRRISCPPSSASPRHGRKKNCSSLR